MGQDRAQGKSEVDVSKNLNEVDSLERLIGRLEQVRDEFNEHLVEYQSQLLAHHSSRLLDVAQACRRQIERVERAAERAAERAERKAADAEQRKYPSYIVEAAEILGITPEEQMERIRAQQKRQRETGQVAGRITYAPDHKVIG